LGFLLAFFYLKGCNSFDDFEWKLLIEGAVSSEPTIFQTDRSQVLYKELKQSLEICDFTMMDYVAPFRNYISSSLQDKDTAKSTRSIEKHEFTNFIKNNNMITKRPTIKKSMSPIYSKRTSEFLLKLINKDYKSPRKNEKGDSSIMKQISFEMNPIENEQPQKFKQKYSSIYTNRLSNFIKNDFLLKGQQENTIEEQTEEENSRQRTEEKIEQEILVIESPNKKPPELINKIDENQEGKMMETNEKNEITVERNAHLCETDSSSSEDEEEINLAKLTHSKTESSKGFLLLSLLKEEKSPGKRKKTFGSPQHFRLKPKKKTMLSTEMNIILQKEAWLHHTGHFYHII